MPENIKSPMDCLWVHFLMVGIVTGFYLYSERWGIVSALIAATLIGTAIFIVNSSLSSAFDGQMEETVKGSVYTRLLKGVASIFYLFPFVMSQVAYAPIGCLAAFFVSHRCFSCVIPDKEHGETNIVQLRFNLKFLLYLTTVLAIGFSQLLLFLKNRSF